MNYELRLLGTPTLLRDAQPVAFKERKGIALLGVLGWTAEPIDRGLLADLLWSERSEPQARTSLRVLLTKLHRAAPGLLKVDRTSVALAPSCRLVHREELAAWRAAGLTPAPSALLSEPIKVPPLRGAPAFERWLEEVWLQWRHDLRVALERVGHEAPGVHDRLAALRQALSLDPWHEGLHRAVVMELLAERRTIDALSHLDALARDLFSEMGLSFSADLTALRQQALAKSWEEHSSHGAGAATPRFGGDEELAELRDLLGDPRVALISLVAPPGAGTSRLMADAALATTGRWVVIDAEGMRATQLWPKLQRAARVKRGAAPDVVAVDNLHGLQDLGELIDRWFAECATHATPPRLLLALHAATGHLRERVVRLRRPTLPTDPALPDFDVQAAAAVPAVQLLLHHAGTGSGRASPISIAQASEIARWVDGHPLALLLCARATVVALEAARAGLAPTALRVEPPAGLPKRDRSLNQVLEVGLEGLPEGQIELLRTLAVCRAPCSLEVLVELAGLETSLLTRLLQKLINRELVIHEVGSDGAARFALPAWLRWLFVTPTRPLQLRHARVFLERARRAADESASRQRAKLLRSMTTEMPDVEAALEALAVEDPLRALLVGTDIAMLERRFGYVEEALVRQRQLLASVRHRLSEEQLADALNALGGLALFAREGSEARAAFGEALALRERLGDREKLAHTLMNLAILDALLGDAKAALTGLQRALEATEGAPGGWTRAAILTNLGNAHYTLGDSRSALAPLDAAARLFWELGDAEGSAGAALGLMANAADVSDAARVAGAYKLVHRALSALSEGADPQLLGVLRHAADRLRDRGFDDYAEDVRRFRSELKGISHAARAVGAL